MHQLIGSPFMDKYLVLRPYEYWRASYELNLGCNYACKHCYLGPKEFSGLPWSERERLLRTLRNAGVLWLQLTGGEPMIEVLTNGSRLSNPVMLDLLTSPRVSRPSLPRISPNARRLLAAMRGIASSTSIRTAWPASAR